MYFKYAVGVNSQKFFAVKKPYEFSLLKGSAIILFRLQVTRKKDEILVMHRRKYVMYWRYMFITDFKLQHVFVKDFETILFSVHFSDYLKSTSLLYKCFQKIIIFNWICSCVSLPFKHYLYFYLCYSTILCETWNGKTFTHIIWKI